MYGLMLTVNNINTNLTNESLPNSNSYNCSFNIPVMVWTESNFLVVPSTQAQLANDGVSQSYLI